MTAAILLAVLSAAAFAAGWTVCHHRYAPKVAQLVAVVEEQRATLTAVPPTAPELRAEAEAFRARNVARVVESAIHHGRRAAA